MGFASVAFNLIRKGYKPLINDLEKTLTYTTKQGIQKKLLFDSADKVKFWQSIDNQSGKMKVYTNLEEGAVRENNGISNNIFSFKNSSNNRISKVEKFENYQPVSTKTITTNKTDSGLPISQEVVKENHLTGEVTSRTNKGAVNDEVEVISAQPANEFNYGNNDIFSSSYDPLKQSYNPSGNIYGSQNNFGYDPLNDPLIYMANDPYLNGSTGFGGGFGDDILGFGL